MGWLDSLLNALSSAESLTEEQRGRLAAWRALPAVDLDLSHGQSRYVVVDVETSGLNPDKDHLISIGAIAVQGEQIDPLDAFEVVLRQDVASSNANILVHGIGGSAQREGEDPAEALLKFLEFVGKSPLIAYHTFFDQTVIDRAAKKHLHLRPHLPWIDLAWVLPELLGSPQDAISGLDPWLERFGIENFQRHNAVADCYATAQLLQIVLRKSLEVEADSPQGLLLIERSRRHLRSH